MDLRTHRPKISEENALQTGNSQEKRSHKRKGAPGGIDDSGIGTRIKKGKENNPPDNKSRTITFYVTYGARAVKNNDDTVDFYLCNSKGSKSETQHTQKKVQIDKNKKLPIELL